MARMTPGRSCTECGMDIQPGESITGCSIKNCPELSVRSEKRVTWCEWQPDFDCGDSICIEDRKCQHPEHGPLGRVQSAGERKPWQIEGEELLPTHVQHEIEDVMRHFGEIPDRTSPDDFPQGYVLTRQEIVGGILKVLVAASSAQSSDRLISTSVPADGSSVLNDKQPTKE